MICDTYFMMASLYLILSLSMYEICCHNIATLNSESKYQLILSLLYPYVLLQLPVTPVADSFKFTTPKLLKLTQDGVGK